MKKFLLLLVGVLFFVCNGVAKDWTIYCDTKNNEWEKVYLFYSSTTTITTTYYVEGVKVGTSTIFKFNFSTDGDYAKVNFSKSNSELKHDGTNGNGDYYSDNTDPKWNLVNNYLYELKRNSNGSETVGEYAGSVVYKYSGVDTNWSTNEESLTDNHDGTYSITRNFTQGNAFGVREIKNTTTESWWWGTDDDKNISNVNTTYHAGKQGSDAGGNWTFNMESGEYTLTFNPTAKTIVFTSTASPAVKTAYTIYFDAVRSGGAAVTLAVDGNPAVTTSTVNIKNHDINKYVFEVVEGTQATFTYDGNALAKFAPVSGQVYYYNGSAQDNEAFEGYTWTPGDTPEPDSPKTIAISGTFYNPNWPGPVTDKAKKFSRVSGSTYTLDLTGYTFDANTEFKIYDVTGIDDKNSWGQGYYNSTAIQPNAPTKLTADNNSGNNIKVDAPIVNPQITLDVATWTITIKAKEVVTTYDYYIHGTIKGDNDWTSYKMTPQADGTWTYTAAFKSEKGFGIKQTESGNANNQTAWIYDADKNASIVLGQVHNCVIKKNDNGVDWATPKNSFDGTTEYTLVFDPEAMTIVFINPAAVSASVATEATTINGSKANNLNVAITVADYYKGTGATSYTLSNGSYSVTSDDGNFTNVPYAANYTLKPDNGSAMPINITLPTTTFDISAQNSTLVAPGSGSGNASLVVYFKANCRWWYNLPQIVCTCGGETISGTVVWNSPEVGTKYEYDFAFIANEVVAYNSVDMKATEDKTFNFVITPVYPFAVEAPAATPAPSMMRVAAANSFQYVYGAAIDNVEPVEITQHGSTVSGVEGVMIEDEEAPVEYFNLQGQRVNGDLAPGIYIRRQGTTVTKVRI